MPDLVIREQELKQLDELLKPIPLQYGYPLVQFINAVGNARQQEAAKALLAQQESLKDKPDTSIQTN